MSGETEIITKIIFLKDELKKYNRSGYKETPSKEECNELCAKHSGKVITYIIKNT